MKKLRAFSPKVAFPNFIIFFTVGALLLHSCSKSTDTPVTPGEDVFILSIDPTAGVAGTVVTINGGGFSATMANNKVKFNGIDAVVQTATATKITAAAPATGTTGSVSIQVGSKSATGPTFTYQAAGSAVVTTYAGSGAEGSANGPAASAQFIKPEGVAVDALGNVYVADRTHRIRKIAPDGTVSTFAGTGEPGFKDGKSTEAKFFNPGKLVCDAQGNVYVCDNTNVRVRKITPNGDVTTFAGNGGCGSTNGPAASASFCGFGGIAVAANGDLYIADANNFKIRKISGGQVSTFAGSTQGLADGTGTGAQFTGELDGMAFDSKGNLFASDNYGIRKIAPSGVVTTFVGAKQNIGNSMDGTGSAATLSSPRGMICDAADNIYFVEATSYHVRKVSPAAVVTTIAGGVRGFKDGVGLLALFDGPADIKMDSKGNMYVADFFNNAIRKITLK